MDKIGHIFVGSALGIILILLTHYFLQWFEINLLNITTLVAIIYVYSLLADIDMKNSTITWSFIGVGVLLLVTGYIMNNQVFLLLGIGLVAITFLAAEFMPHRGFTHSLLFGILVSLPWLYFSWHYCILAFLCYYSHLAADGEFFKLV